MHKNKVSIIVPAFNAEKSIKKCLQSIQKQSFRNIEVIIINDGSNDGTLDVCKKLAKTCELKLFSISHSGPATARNMGLEKASGEFVFFLDADDYLPSNSIKVLVNQAKKERSDITIGSFTRRDFRKKRSEKIIPLNKNQILFKKQIALQGKKYLDVPNKNILFAFSWGRLFARKIIIKQKIKFNPHLCSFEDLDFNWRFLKHVSKVSFVSQNVYFYLVNHHNSSATFSFQKRPDELFGFPTALISIQKTISSLFSTTPVKISTDRAYVALSIIQLIRLCNQINLENIRAIFNYISFFIRTPKFCSYLKHYFPKNDESRIIPLLLRFQWSFGLIVFCKIKATLRY